MASGRPRLFVVDGSNIATEGRSTPSLEQLNEAVLAFMEEFDDVEVTVVVDATFGHRIAKKETKAFDAAVANNELVTPPAGAIGRGDAFVLSIANKAKAGVLSNDSFQEFHGEYDWLFDEGRLVGGKPVPHVGWVFVDRTPVRGPKSRQAVRAAQKDSDEPTAEKDRAKRRVKRKKQQEAPEPAEDVVDDTSTDDELSDDDESFDASAMGSDQQATINAAKAAKGPRDHVNELMPFLEFVEHHPVGTSITAVVESYSSHGAYAQIEDVLVYIPLRLMDDPAPRSARSKLTVGETVELVIVGYVPDRRSVDAALPAMAPDRPAEASPAGSDEPAAESSRRRSSTKKKAASRKTSAAKRRASAKKKAAAKSSPAKKKAAAKKSATKSAAKQPAKKKAAAKQPAKKKSAAKRPAKRKAAAKRRAPTGSPGAEQD